jgi:hypothetical protein
MKLQDILFFIVFGMLLMFRKPQLFVFAGLTCLAFAIPLFATWTFFTAERVTWYAAVFFVSFILISLMKPNTVQ